VHAASERRGHEAYRLLRDDCGARVMRIIAVIERVAEASKEGWRDRPPYLQEDAIITARSVSPDGYGRFLIDSFEDWDAISPHR